MAAGYLPLEMQRNEDWTRSMRLRDTDGAPIEIDATTFAMHVRNTAGDPAPPIAAAVVEITDSDQAEITVTIPGSSFASVPGGQEPVELAYDLRATSEGVSVVLMRGPLTLLPGVTQA